MGRYVEKAVYRRALKSVEEWKSAAQLNRSVIDRVAKLCGVESVDEVKNLEPLIVAELSRMSKYEFRLKMVAGALRTIIRFGNGLIISRATCELENVYEVLGLEDGKDYELSVSKDSERIRERLAIGKLRSSLEGLAEAYRGAWLDHGYSPENLGDEYREAIAALADSSIPAGERSVDPLLREAGELLGFRWGGEWPESG